jgi:RHS repeat-associated protein
MTGERYYYHSDHQGSITHLTNEDGEIVETFTYDNAYGTINKHEQTEVTYNPYCYTAREFDSHDLYYYRARYYDPSIGRFISKDPIEFMAGDFNFYRYVGNDPINYTDPSGLVTAVLGGEAGGALGTMVLPGIGTVIGAVAGTIVGGLIGWWMVSDSDEAKSEADTKSKTGFMVKSATSNTKVPCRDVDCKKLANKINNIKSEIEKRTQDLIDNSLNLPYDPPSSNSLPRDSIKGHEELLEEHKDNLKVQEEGFNTCCK